MRLKLAGALLAIGLFVAGCPALVSDPPFFVVSGDAAPGANVNEDSASDDGASMRPDAPSSSDSGEPDAQLPRDSGGPDVQPPRDSGGGDATVDACVPDPSWCNTHCGPGKDNCGAVISCPSCPAEAGCGTGACDSGDQCCTGYCGASGTCVSTCPLASGSCTVIGTACCYGLTCTMGFPPVIHTCK
jgi:hypothetical protein